MSINSIDSNSLKWEFSYEDSHPLAVLHSCAQDFWGYYNGQGGIDFDFIPKTLVYTYMKNPLIVGGNRESDFNYMKLGILTKIKYPTGGFVEYEYEPNKYFDNEVLERKEIAQRTIKEKAMNGSPIVNNTMTYPPSINETVTIQEDVPNELADVWISFSGYERLGTGPMIGKVYIDNQCILSDAQYPSNEEKVIRAKAVLHKNSIIRIELNTNSATIGKIGASASGAPTIEAGISFKYYNISKIPIGGKIAGGLRIKSIKNHASNDIATSQRYEYSIPTQPDGLGLGILLNDPHKQNVYYSDFLKLNQNGSFMYIASHVNITSSSKMELGVVNGSPVFYPRVSVYTASNYNDIYKTLYNFKSPIYYWDVKPELYYGENQHCYPFWANSKSLPESILFFKLKDGRFSLVRKINRDYRLQKIEDVKI